MVQVIGIDHIYLSVSNLATAEQFYDGVLGEVLEFRKNEFELGGEPHIQYFNREFGVVLRPARVAAEHQPYSPGLHHLCLRVRSQADVEAAASRLRARGIQATDVAHFPEYAHDYFATFLDDPDGIRLEITNFRQERRERQALWES
jgi:catechol 2,3-dioxygenase-like lactoylglutathione lyase family enzyme